MNTEKRTSKSVWIILGVCVIVLAVAGILVVVLKMQQPENTGLAYEANVITDNEDALQNAVDALAAKAQEGQMALEMQTQATSEDGIHFKCYLGNSAENQYDMYMVLYRDDTQEEIYRSGLIPTGARIEEFELAEALPEGIYNATLVYNQVEEDKETVHAQVNVGLLLIVK